MRVLALASALLLLANVLLMVAVFLNFVGSVGGWDATKTLWAAFGLDLAGTAFLGYVFLATAQRTEGRSRGYRIASGSLLLAWFGLTSFWRFGLPALMGTDLLDLMVTLITSQGALPVRISRYAPLVYQLLGAWILAAAVLLVAQITMALDARSAPEDDWVRGLPVYAWTLGAGVSFAATVLIAVALVSVLQGRGLSDNFSAWALAKMIVAPNILISGYASSLQLGRDAARASARTAEES